MPTPRKPIFRGWYVAVTLSLCGVALYGCGFYAFVVFVTPLATEFHWSRAAVGSLVSAFWLAAPLALVSDRLLARFSARQLILAGIVLEACCLMVLCGASQLWQMYLLRALAGVGKILYAITIPNVLAKWFSRRFGTALALVYCGWHVGGLVLAPFAHLLIDSAGWRAASLVLGVCVLLIALPGTLWFLRVPSAAAAGLALDGDDRPAAEVTRPVQAAPSHRVTTETLREVLQNRAFLLIAIGTALYCLSYSGVLAHQAAAIQDFGVSAQLAALIVGCTAGFAVVGAPLIGWLIDRCSLTWVTAVQYGINMAGIACLLAVSHVTDVWLLGMHAVLLGLSVGGTDVFWITTLKREVPERLFPTAFGLWYFMSLVGIAVGPTLAGLLYDLSGSYVKSLSAELVNLALPLIMCLLVSSRRRVTEAVAA